MLREGRSKDPISVAPRRRGNGRRDRPRLRDGKIAPLLSGRFGAFALVLNPQGGLRELMGRQVRRFLKARRIQLTFMAIIALEGIPGVKLARRNDRALRAEVDESIAMLQGRGSVAKAARRRGGSLKAGSTSYRVITALAIQNPRVSIR